MNIDKLENKSSISKNVFRIRTLKQNLKDQEEIKKQRYINSKQNKALKYLKPAWQIFVSLFVDKKIITEAHPEGLKINWTALQSLATVLMIFLTLGSLNISYQANETSKKALEETRNKDVIEKVTYQNNPTLDLKIKDNSQITFVRHSDYVGFEVSLELLNNGLSKAYDILMYGELTYYIEGGKTSHNATMNNYLVTTNLIPIKDYSIYKNIGKDVKFESTLDLFFSSKNAINIHKKNVEINVCLIDIYLTYRNNIGQEFFSLQQLELWSDSIKVPPIDQKSSLPIKMTSSITNITRPYNKKIDDDIFYHRDVVE
ncbi:MAG: hypothetical protein HGA95_00085 [Caldiserica bacterium]|nr:hypothetical protein [Caldisericota bacterium]